MKEKASSLPGPDIVEERERLFVYQAWPELPSKVRQSILRRVSRCASILACPAKGLEVPGTENVSGRNQAATLKAISPSSSATSGNQP